MSSTQSSLFSKYNSEKKGLSTNEPKPEDALSVEEDIKPTKPCFQFIRDADFG
jgi:hypothetical protein